MKRNRLQTFTDAQVANLHPRKWRLAYCPVHQVWVGSGNNHTIPLDCPLCKTNEVASPKDWVEAAVQQINQFPIYGQTPKRGHQ